MSREDSKYPSTFYRVSLKAIIRNAKMEVLLVEENDHVWTFPGGGIEHGETEMEALKRELYEEARITQPFTAVPLGFETIYVESHDAWVLWVFYDVKVEGELSFASGDDDILSVKFKDSEIFKNSSDIWEQNVYKWTK